MRKFFVSLNILFVFLALTAMKGDKPAYHIFNGEGKSRDYSDLLKAAAKADIVFFGELHDNSLCHWIELQLTKDLFAEHGKNLMLGAEMFESDNQLLLDEYLGRKAEARNFNEEAKLWPNYKTDYKPLVEFAKSNDIAVIATNVPRRYASMVNKRGYETLDSLNPAAWAWIAPLPITYDSTLKCYADMLKDADESHATPNLPRAQALKDATMAHFILKNWEKGKVMLHFNGSYHSDNYLGIVWYVKQQNPDLKILTISTVEQDTLSVFDKENENIADFILTLPSDMTKTR